MEIQNLQQKNPQQERQELEQKSINELTGEAISEVDLNVIRKMMECGLMYGHKKSKTIPRFKKYILAARNGIEIIDLTQTLFAMESAVEFFKSQIINNKGMVLIVASQPAAKEAVENFAKKFNFAYINERWVGGLLTNFKVLSQRIEYFKKVQADFEKGEFDKYTKKERVMINKNIQRMKKMFTGLENLTKLPDAIFVIDPSLKGHATAVREARRIKIPIIAVLDSDDDPILIDYSIPANDHAKMSIDWLINKISDSLESNKYSETISE